MGREALDSVQQLFTLKGILTLGTFGGVIALTGPWLLPYLALGGVGLGLAKIIPNARRACLSYERSDIPQAEQAMGQVGRGAFLLGTSTLSARFAWRHRFFGRKPEWKGLSRPGLHDIRQYSRQLSEEGRNLTAYTRDAGASALAQRPQNAGPIRLAFWHLRQLFTGQRMLRREIHANPGMQTMAKMGQVADSAAHATDTWDTGASVTRDAREQIRLRLSG